MTIVNMRGQQKVTHLKYKFNLKKVQYNRHWPPYGTNMAFCFICYSMNLISIYTVSSQIMVIDDIFTTVIL
jgi:hypothetical protein